MGSDKIRRSHQAGIRLQDAKLFRDWVRETKAELEKEHGEKTLEAVTASIEEDFLKSMQLQWHL